MGFEPYNEPAPMTEPQKAQLLSLLRGIPELRELHAAVRDHFRWEDQEAGKTMMVDTESGPEYTKAEPVVADRADVRVSMCIAFPGGKPKCAQCDSTEITHTVVYEITQHGEISTAFGCVCSDCAKDIETELKAGEN